MNIDHTLVQIDRAFIDIGNYRRGVIVNSLPNFAVLLDCALEEIEPSTPRKTVTRINEQIFHAYQLFSHVHVETYITDLYEPDWDDGFCIDTLTLRYNPNGRCVEETEHARLVESSHPDYRGLAVQHKNIVRHLLNSGRYLWQKQSFYLTHVQRTGAVLTDAALRCARRLALSLPPFYERLEGWRPTNGLFIDYAEKLIRRHLVAPEEIDGCISSAVVELLYRANTQRPEREGRKRMKYWNDVSPDLLAQMLNDPRRLTGLHPLHTNKCYAILNGVSHTIATAERRNEWVKQAEQALRGVRLSQHSFRSDGSEEEDEMELLFGKRN